MNYDALRHFADSWGLVLMGIVFLVLTGWTFRKGSRAANERAARSILEEDDG
ncbi:cbb3-type cytochrome oxidase subunit 3 (plasmid) [Sphingobium naphthae]|uniref:cbb3-type cytochrome oxidase subunit 3 n=1 Tax=Sphingobium naphthae TaxID=1886786 RepID=UPI000C97667F|nr:CcoQ/FixQ family Cbb3-type cytochrome c oxidase assembly chaperone [Erythrobacter sp.]|tara:strand:+ start:1631 stop:1786 length:156 start_codon:yes stop_codon:yes gene_type:complete